MAVAEGGPGATRALMLALLAFFLGTAGVRRCVPAPDDFVVSDKLAWYAEHAADYDTVIIGSSRTYRGLVPAVIERRLERLGHSARIFNMGAQGLGGFEQQHVIEQVLELGGEHLERVVIEERGWPPFIPSFNRKTQRAVGWHDPLDTVRAVAASLRLSPDEGDSTELALMHLGMFARWIGNYGQGWRIVRHQIGRDPEPLMTDAEFAEHAGWRSLEMEQAAGDVGATRRRELFLEQLSEYETAVKLLRIENRQEGDRDAYDLASLRRQIASVQSLGLDVVHVLPPGLDSTPTVFALDADGAFPLLIAFNNPAKYPRLYRPEMRFDDEHLAENGAAELSGLFAVALHERLLQDEP